MYVTVKQDKKLSAKPYMKNLMQMWFQEIFGLTPCSDMQQTSLRILFPTNSRTSLTFALPFLSMRNILVLCNYHHFNWSLNTTCCHLIERENKSAETKPQINNAFSIFTRIVLFTVKRWREKMAFLRGIVTRGGQCHFTKDDFEHLCSWEKKIEMLITYSSFPFPVPARLLYFRIIFEDATYWINQSINSPHANT